MDYEILIRFLLAVLWGGLVGAEREYRSKSAGFRTMIMISVGSCLFTMLSVHIGTPGNPDRIASNIVTGIGFLGAGVIFHRTGGINGITTAATIWAVAAVGMSIGSGHYTEASYAGVLILIVLSLLPYAEELIDKWNQTKTYSVSGTPADEVQQRTDALFARFHLKQKLIGQQKEGDLLTFTWIVQGSSVNHQLFANAATAERWIKQFEY